MLSFFRTPHMGKLQIVSPCFGNLKSECSISHSQVPQLYCIQLGVQYPKNSKIFLWLLPQPSSGNALVCVDKNWNISGLLSGFQLEKLFFIHTVRSYSHSTATAEFVISIGLKKWDGFLTFSNCIIQERAKYCPGEIWKCWNVKNTVDLRLLMTLQIRRWPLQIRRWQ